MRPRMLIVSGLSCAGKTPLIQAARKLALDLLKEFSTPVLYHSRAARPGEIDGRDYHFRSREDIEALRDKPGFSVFEVRSELQAVDVNELDSSRALLYEGHASIALFLKKWSTEKGLAAVDIFLSPLSAREVDESMAKAGPDGFRRQLTEMSRGRLLRRYRKQKETLGLPELEDVETRAGSAFEELARGHEFSHVVPNHDGEDSDHWTLFDRPIGDALRATEAVLALLRGEAEDWSERWRVTRPCFTQR